MTMTIPLKLVVVVLLIVHGGEAFQLPPRSDFAVLPMHQSLSSLSRSHHSDLSMKRFSLLQMTSTEEQLEEDKSLVVSAPPDQDDSTGGGLKRTLLLAIPLFCKFVVVLFIKFLTDAVVFPLLFMYRLARITKRKIKSLFTKKNDAPPPNGELSPPSNE